MRVLLLGGCGYVGSALHEHLVERGFHVHTLDLEWFGRNGNADNERRDYASLSRAEVARFDAVILLAGHSSVAMCSGNREASLRNNVVNFVNLLGKLDSQRFIYASSASVYGATCGAAAAEDWPRFTPASYYDLCKYEIDGYAQLSGLDYYGLRFGTVNGAAPHFRVDVMLNKMHHSSRTGAITISNPDVSRPILGMRDLCRAVGRILATPRAQPGIYNLASLNATVGELGERAAAALHCELRIGPRSPSYDMRMSTAKFESAFGIKFEESVESIVASLARRPESALATTREAPRPYPDATPRIVRAPSRSEEALRLV